jgi:hypothetical protein
MSGVTVAGSWRVRVMRKDSDWVHRVVITGSASVVIPGRVGESAEVQGERWRLTIERPRGSHGLGPRARFMAVRVRNTSYKPYGYGARLAVSDAGRRALAGHGILVEDWTPATVRATGQEVFGSAVGVPPLGVGQHAIAYFPVDTSRSRAGTADIEFVLGGTGGPGSSARPARTGPVPFPVPVPVPVPVPQ